MLEKPVKEFRRISKIIFDKIAIGINQSPKIGLPIVLVASVTLLSLTSREIFPGQSDHSFSEFLECS